MIPVLDHKESKLGLGYDTFHSLLAMGNLKGFITFVNE